MKQLLAILIIVTVGCQQNEPQKVTAAKNAVPEITYYDNGMVKSVANLIDGKPEGKAIMFDEDGYKLREQNYSNGKLDGIQYQFQKGILFSEEFFMNGARNGWSKYYNVECGFITEEGLYKNDEKSGVWIEYFGREVDVVRLYDKDSLISSEFKNVKFKVEEGQPPLDPSLELDCCCK